jgi:flagellar hook-associated protein 2
MAAIDYVTAMGAGSGINTTEVVDALVEAQRAPQQQSIDRLKTKADVQISAYGLIKSSLDTLRSAFDTLNDVSDLKKFDVSSSNSAILDGTASANAIAGDYAIAVNTLAERTVWNTNIIAAATSASPINGGAAFSFDIDQNGTVTTITVTTDTPAGIQKAVNKARIGLTAGLIDTGNGFVVSLAGDYGRDNDFIVQNIQNNAAMAASRQSTAVNADLTVNGVTVSRAANTVSDAVPGVTMTLKAVTAAQTLTVTQDPSTLETALRNLVAVYNETEVLFDELSNGANPDDSLVGSLRSDSSFRGIRSAIRSVLTNPSSTPSGAINYLSDIGVQFERDGSLSINESRFSEALSSQFTDIVQALTAGTDNQSIFSTENAGLAGDMSVLIFSYTRTTGSVSTTILARTEDLQKYEDDLEDLSRRMAIVKDRYVSQFSAMQAIVDEMNSTRDYLKQQLESLPFSSKD